MTNLGNHASMGMFLTNTLVVILCFEPTQLPPGCAAFRRLSAEFGLELRYHLTRRTDHDAGICNLDILRRYRSLIEVYERRIGVNAGRYWLLAFKSRFPYMTFAI